MVVPRPEPGATRPYQFPRFHEISLDNGLRLVVASVRKLPLVTVSMVLDAGATTEPRGSEGVADLTARGLLEGTAGYDGGELAERLERLGAAIDTEVRWDSAVITMTTVTARFPAALDLFGEVVLYPSFPVREIERIRGERLAEILQLRAEPRGLADEMFGRFIYVPDSRYAQPEHGAASSVEELTLPVIETFYHERYHPGVATLILVGDISVDDAIRLANCVFGNWRAGTATLGIADDRSLAGVRGFHIIEKVGASQSELRIGHVGLPRRHPDYFAAVVMNAIFGGLFGSRVNLNLREVHAYTYGAHSAFEWRRNAGPFLVDTAVRSEVTAAAVVEVLREIDRIRNELVTSEELSLATSFLAGVFPIRYETTATISRALAAMITYDLPSGYFDEYRDQISAISAVDVQRVAQQHLRSEELQIIAVGDPAIIRDPLAKLGLGPVTVYDADDSMWKHMSLLGAR